MRVLKNLFGKGDKIHVDEIIMGSKKLLSTGVIVEEGFNSNGSFFKFGNGLMICYHSTERGPINTPASGLFSSASYEWTFPHEFLNANIELTGTIKYAAGGAWVTHGDVNNSAQKGSYRILNTTSTGSVTVGIMLMAIGKWK